MQWYGYVLHFLLLQVQVFAACAFISSLFTAAFIMYCFCFCYCHILCVRCTLVGPRLLLLLLLLRLSICSANKFHNIFHGQQRTFMSLQFHLFYFYSAPLCIKSCFISMLFIAFLLVFLDFVFYFFIGRKKKQSLAWIAEEFSKEFW